MADASESVGEWQKVGVDSPLLAGASTVPLVSFKGQLELLPFESIEVWADFESLLWRVLWDVEGLRDVYMYGVPGQAQLGLDVVGQAPDDSWVAVQSKKHKQFGPQSLQNAVDEFLKKSQKFKVSKFVIGVSREVRSTASVNKIAELKEKLDQVEFVVWDKRKLSEMLREHPSIVREYFGEPIAEAFCAPWVSTKIKVPAADAVAVRDAVARTPENSTGAGKLIAEARNVLESDPGTALELVERAQAKLTDQGFAGHAAKHEELRASLLVTMGRGEEGTRRRLDDLWAALELGHSVNAQLARQDISNLALKADSDAAKGHLMVADQALSLYVNPLASVPDWDATQIGSKTDRARLALLAGETSLAASNQDWLAENAESFTDLAHALDEADDAELGLAVRLQLLAAEGTGDWKQIHARARTGKFGHALAGLVAARFARYSALNQEFELAEASWDEATQCACLAHGWTDAANWTFARRSFRSRWKPFTTNELLPVQTALATRGPTQRVVTCSEDAVENAYIDLSGGRLRSAAIAAQRALRDAVTLGDWGGERSARRLLAEVLKVSGEPVLAAEHLVRDGSVGALKQLAADCPNDYLDVASLLGSTPYWVAGAAYRLIAAQSDLVPDDQVEAIGDQALSEIDALKAGSLVDLFGFAESRFQGAIAVLGALAGRLNDEQADRALTYFEGQGPVEPNHYRHHDDDEAAAVAAMVTHHPALEARALRHLIALLARAQGSRTVATVTVVYERLESARVQLTELARSGDTWATGVLAAEDATRVDADLAQDALGRLTTALKHAPGAYAGGGGGASITDSILIGNLPVPDKEAALAQLLERADDPRVFSSDRASYLRAASNLAPAIESPARANYLDEALRLVLKPTPSTADEVTGSSSHPLGIFRMPLANSSRGEAVFLAAALAREPLERERVRDAAFSLVGDEAASEYWVTRALQRLGDALVGDVGFLSGQGTALKSLAGILWSKNPAPAPVGLRLAADEDPEVRRALARALADHPADNTNAGRLRAHVIAQLAMDPCFSVRSALTKPPNTN